MCTFTWRLPETLCIFKGLIEIIRKPLHLKDYDGWCNKRVTYFYWKGFGSHVICEIFIFGNISKFLTSGFLVSHILLFGGNRPFRFSLGRYMNVKRLSNGDSYQSDRLSKYQSICSLHSITFHSLHYPIDFEFTQFTHLPTQSNNHHLNLLLTQSFYHPLNHPHMFYNRIYWIGSVLS